MAKKESKKSVKKSAPKKEAPKKAAKKVAPKKAARKRAPKKGEGLVGEHPFHLLYGYMPKLKIALGK